MAKALQCEFCNRPRYRHNYRYCQFHLHQVLKAMRRSGYLQSLPDKDQEKGPPCKADVTAGRGLRTSRG